MAKNITWWRELMEIRCKQNKIKLEIPVCQEFSKETVNHRTASKDMHGLLSFYHFTWLFYAPVWVWLSLIWHIAEEKLLIIYLIVLNQLLSMCIGSSSHNNCYAGTCEGTNHTTREEFSGFNHSYSNFLSQHQLIHCSWQKDPLVPSLGTSSE